MEAQVASLAAAPAIRSPANRWWPWLAAALTVWLGAWWVWLLWQSRHWPLIGDQPVLLYMGWLANHGMVLYRDVVEIQFPGSVMVYRWQQMLFGPSDAGFRLFDFAVLGSLFASMLAIVQGKDLAGPTGRSVRGTGQWFAAVFGFSFFFWWHTGTPNGNEGMGQRDFLVAALLLAGTVALLKAVRDEAARGAEASSMRAMQWMAVFGACVGLAMTMKPPEALFLLLPLPAFRASAAARRHGRAALAWLAAGVALALLSVLVYLLIHGALGAFVATERRMLPLYVGLPQPTRHDMIDMLLQPKRLLPVLTVACGALALCEPLLRRSPVQQTLLLGAVLGAVCYFAQHKGFYYHREPFNAFFFPWVGWVLTASVLHARRWLALGSVAVLVASSLLYPHLLRPASGSLFESRMEGQLRSLGALEHDGQVQCIDTVEGCTTVLLRAKKTMSTGTLDEYLLFSKRDSPSVREEQSLFLGKLQLRRPEFFVITNTQYPASTRRGYDTLPNWPAFYEYLSTNYVLAYELLPTADEVRGYRVYRRK